MRWLVALAWTGCAATVPLDEHNNQMAAERAQYELRLRRLTEDARRAQGQTQDRDNLSQALAAEKLKVERLTLQLAETHRWRRESPGKSPLEPLAKTLGGRVEGGEIRLEYSDFFAAGSAILEPKAAPVLAQLTELVLPKVELILVVVAHTEHADGEARGLSAQQGLAIVAALEAQGWDPGRLALEIWGAARPRADAADREGRAKNRRIELRLRPR